MQSRSHFQTVYFACLPFHRLLPYACLNQFIPIWIMAKVNYLNSAECKSTNQFVRLWQQPLDMNVLLSYRTNICTYICSSYIVPSAINIHKTRPASSTLQTHPHSLTNVHAYLSGTLGRDVQNPFSLVIFIFAHRLASTLKIPKSERHHGTGTPIERLTSVMTSTPVECRVFNHFPYSYGTAGVPAEHQEVLRR